ncbi:LysR substrate-binding domain-containing protein [Kiritimatiellota bacterium B12222]|nr:LysR substrate-binding domain-containing protein [Kiritimatiellota bacterium B12222]
MNITLRQLEVFCAIAKWENVSRAAEDAVITQSAASMALGELERQLGEKLFDRFGKKLHLNNSGKQLLPKAQEALQRAGEIEGMFALSHQTGGELKTGASTTIGNYLIPGLLSSFCLENPHMHIALQIGNSDQIIDSLLACENDIAFIEGPCTHPNIETRIWQADELVVCAPPEHPLAGKEALTPEDLVGAKWILREPGSGTRAVFQRASEMLPGSLDIRHELGHAEAIKQLVRSGLGISCLSRLALKQELALGMLVELPTPFLDLKRNLSLLLRKSKYHTEILRLFLKHVEGTG